jgi:tRNA-modifying protein YgfZ
MQHDAVAETIASGAAFVDLSWWRVVSVSGTDARTWLNDLISADIGDLRPGGARRSLLLSPTGRIRAEFTLADHEGTILLLQDPTQPRSIRELLSPYVLSSNVRLEDRTADTGLFAFPGSPAAPDVAGTVASTPSCTGRGVDLLCAMEDHDGVLASLSREYGLADAEALEAWRVSAGIPRFGVDALDDDLPQEGGFGDAVAADKGCYLGQEAMAKVRNLGHPRRVLLHVQAGAPLRAGDAVRADGESVGEITSATGGDDRWWALAKVRWRDRAAPLATTEGVSLTPS